jgi:oligopeptide/dipeptide ABC transporter ATP-binding protein
MEGHMIAAPEHLLEVNNLSIGLRRDHKVVDIIDDVSFHIDHGETLGIVGESGCGKSTTGLAILRLTPRSSRPYTRGTIRFDGHNVLEMDDEALRRIRGHKISMILQDPMSSLNPVFTIGNQIAEAITTHHLEGPAGVRQQVVDSLQQVRIPSPEARVNSYPHQLSGGMKQRVVGAIAISCRPSLLIADEPTTALDVTTQALYLQLLKDLQRELNMALMFITHDFDVVARMCDRVCVMYAGQIVESASVLNIFQQPKHWYSAALIGGIPALKGRTERLVSIPGAPPSPGDMPTGCRFAPRCPNARERCRSEQPSLTTQEAGRQVRCWYPRDDDMPAAGIA